MGVGMDIHPYSRQRLNFLTPADTTSSNKIIPTARKEAAFLPAWSSAKIYFCLLVCSTVPPIYLEKWCTTLPNLERVVPT